MKTMQTMQAMQTMQTMRALFNQFVGEITIFRGFLPLNV